MALEDALTAEFQEQEVNLETIAQELRASITGLETLKSQIEALRHVMEERDFKDIPTIASLDWNSIGATMVSDGLITKQEWDVIWPIMKEKGFFGVLEHFTAMHEQLSEKTKTLLGQVDNLEDSSSVIDVLEKNRAGNIKIAFAQLYTTWANFHQGFLASSMISTEVWYAFNKFGSLIDSSTKTCVA